MEAARTLECEWAGKWGFKESQNVSQTESLLRGENWLVLDFIENMKHGRLSKIFSLYMLSY